MKDIYDTVRYFMTQGMTLDESISELESKLHTQFTEDLKALIKQEIGGDKRGG